MKRDRPPVNPAILIWAREQSGKSIEEVSFKFKKVLAWEKDESRPTVKQARELADYYGRSFIEFFRSTPPPIREPVQIPDFRMERGVSGPREHIGLKNIQLWAEAQRINALDLFAELGEHPPEVPRELFATMQESPESVAERARTIIGFDISEQIKLKLSERNELPKILRKKFEGIGILVLKHTGIKEFAARGICIVANPLPLIVYGNEFPGAQAFTLAHEFAHIALQQSGVIGSVDRTCDKPTEIWCDKFAASFLMPSNEIHKILGRPYDSPAENISDAELAEIADIFRVSAHAMLIRLVHLKYVAANYYWQIKKPEFEQVEREYKAFGRPKYYGSRYKSSLGDFYTSLVIEAWSAGRITNHNAAEYMGIKNISHLFEIRSNFKS